MKKYLKMFMAAWSGGSKKKILISLSVIGIISVFAVGLTVSYFRDTETSTGNKFQAGKLNLKIDNTCHYNGMVCNENKIWAEESTGSAADPDMVGTTCECTWSVKDLAGELFFNFLDVKPGDKGEDTVSLHVDNNDAWVCAELANLKNFDNGCDKPENNPNMDATCDNPGEGQGELQDNLYFTIWKDTDCDNILDKETAGAHCVANDPSFEHDCGTVQDEVICNTVTPPGEPQNLLCHWVAGQSAEQVLVENQKAGSNFWPIADSTTGTPIKGGDTTCLGVAWNVPIETTNIIQTDSLEGDVVFNAVQSRHMPNFKCSDLYVEVCDGIDNTYNNQVDEGPLWANKGQSCSVGTGACVATGTWTCDANNSAGETVCSATAGTPGEEICDGLDNDCDGEVDEDAKTTFYQDTDSDGYGNISTTTQACVAPVGYVANNTDCDDSNATVHPGAVEIPGDGIDQDCSGTDATTCYRDQDMDGYGLLTTIVIAADGSCDKSQNESASSNDCNDNNVSISPMGIEVPGNNLDENCSGMVACYIDSDNDGYGSSGIVQDGYAATNGTATTPCGINNTDGLDDTSNDCNDTNSAIRPNAFESCNNIDDNCNNMTDEGLSMRNYYKDYDNDTYANPNDFLYRCGPTGDYDMTWIGQVDCNDNNANIHPFAQEYCNGTDEDCDGQTDENFPEQWTECRSCSSPFGGWDPYWTCVSGSLVCPPC